MARRSRRSSPRPRWVTLSTDMGSAYAAQMKAVLAHHVPPGHLLDLTHELRPHDPAEAAFVLRETIRRFPAGAVHVVVVDPGVGGRRRPIVLAGSDGTSFVGPDNGLLPALAESRGPFRAFALVPQRVEAAPRVGTTFDGRDLFAPAAAALATGVRPAELGAPTEVLRLRRREPRRTHGRTIGEVAHVDRFGNLVTNVPSAWTSATSGAVRVRLGRRVLVARLARGYDEATSGAPVVVRSSFGTLELALAQRRAADVYRAQVGTKVEFGGPARPGARPRRKRK